jgi:hypothetical protein
MSRNKIGLTLGLFLAIFHAIWSVFVAIIPMGVQNFMNWVLNLHHINIPFYIITPFMIGNAILLIVITFIFGYIFGWVVGLARDLVMKKKTEQIG